MHFSYLGAIFLLLTLIVCVASTNEGKRGDDADDDIDDKVINSLIGSFLKKDKVDDGEEQDIVNGLKAIIHPDEFSGHRKRKGGHHKHAKLPGALLPTDIENESNTINNKDDKEEGDIDSELNSADTEDEVEYVKTKHSGDNSIKHGSKSNQEDRKTSHDPEDGSLTLVGKVSKDEEEPSHNFDETNIAPLEGLHSHSSVKSKGQHIAQSPNIEKINGSPLSKLFDDILRKHDTWRKTLPKNGKSASDKPTKGYKRKNAFNDVKTLQKHTRTQLVTTHQVMDEDAANEVSTLPIGMTVLPDVRTHRTYSISMFYRDHAVWVGSLFGVLFTVCLLVIGLAVYKVILKYKRQEGININNSSFGPFKGRKLDESPMYIRLSHINNSKGGNHYVVSVLDDKEDKEENDWSSEEEVFNVSNIKPTSPAVNRSVPVGTSTPLGTPIKRNNNNNSFNYRSYR